MRWGLSALMALAVSAAMMMQPATLEAATKKKQSTAKAHPVAVTKHASKKKGKANAATAAQLEARKSAILVDAATGEVLFADRPDELRYPASLTKMMTLYLAFDALKSGRLNLNQALPVSAHAAGQEPSNLQLRAGETITVEDAILGTSIKSANDAAVVLAEAIGGSEDQFARMMTQRARQLGMAHTTYRNANGLPNPDQQTTARDLATLGTALIRDHKAYYHYFGYTEFTFRGRAVPGHNRITANYDGADGLKTGFIRASGFNIVSSAKRDGRRLIGVVMGGDSGFLRDRQMTAMLDRGFANETIVTAAVRRVPTIVAPAVASDYGRSDQIADAGTAAPAASDATPLLQAMDTLPANPAPLKRSVKPTAQVKPVAVALKPIMKAGADVIIQIGAFSRKAAAEAQLAEAAKSVKVGAPVIVPDASGKLYRARFAGLTEAEARAACNNLKRQNLSCAVLPAS